MSFGSGPPVLRLRGEWVLVVLMSGAHDDAVRFWAKSCCFYWPSPLWLLLLSREPVVAPTLPIGRSVGQPAGRPFVRSLTSQPHLLFVLSNRCATCVNIFCIRTLYSGMIGTNEGSGRSSHTGERSELLFLPSTRAALPHSKCCCHHCIAWLPIRASLTARQAPSLIYLLCCLVDAVDALSRPWRIAAA